MLLAPCPACHRHVADAICVFCGAPVSHALAGMAARGRVSRAVVFGAALLGAGCGGKQKATSPDESGLPREHHGGGGCAPPDQAEIDRLEKQKAEAPEEDKPSIEAELERARQPVCMPYGAPPSRRRVV